MYPLDVVKTRAQLHVGAGTSMLTALVQMVRNEGYVVDDADITRPIFLHQKGQKKKNIKKKRSLIL